MSNGVKLGQSNQGRDNIRLAQGRVEAPGLVLWSQVFQDQKEASVFISEVEIAGKEPRSQLLEEGRTKVGLFKFDQFRNQDLVGLDLGPVKFVDLNKVSAKDNKKRLIGVGSG